ncbi:hypothetical protein JVW18_22850, partial [Vibrio cholerae O1]|nr:hypothetical protein [Vibrio cholerae O1]
SPTLSREAGKPIRIELTIVQIHSSGRICLLKCLARQVLSKLALNAYFFIVGLKRAILNVLK